MTSIKTLSIYFLCILFLTACGGGGSDKSAKDKAIEKITAYAQDSSNAIPTLQDYLDAGVTGVNNTNLTQINSIVDGLEADDVDTTAEIEALTTQLNINIVPTVDAGSDKTVQVNQSITLNGTAIDNDGSIVSFEWTKGTTVLATTASFNYTPTEVGTDTLTLTVTDNDGGTARDNTDVKVTSLPIPNEVPIVNAGVDKIVQLNQSITITGTASDSDGTITSFEWTKGTEVLATTASFNYTPTAIGTDILTLTVIDNDGESSSDTTDVEVTSASVANIAPTVNAGEDKTVTVNQSIIIEGTADDSNGTIASYEWKNGSTVLANTASFGYTPDTVGTDTLTLTVTDNDGATASDNIEVEVQAATNAVPTVNAGVDKVVQQNEDITITGTGSDSDGSIASYEWSKGTTILATTASFVYTPTAVGTDTLTLTVTDNNGATASDNINVEVTSIPVTNIAPTANAGPDKSVIVNESIVITGTADDSNGTITSYEWKKGSTTLATTASFSYTPTDTGTDVLTLTVTDNDGDTASDSTNVEVLPISNVAPTANAGADRTVQLNQSITITGSGSDSGGTITSYEWSKGATLLATTASFSYTPTAVGTDTLTLTVTDNDGDTASDSMEVVVTPIPNAPPSADAGGDKTVTVDHPITITGSGSDDDGTIDSYEWKIGTSTTANTASFTYTPSVVGEFKLTLIVTDNDGATASDTIIVDVIPNSPPTANAGVDVDGIVGQNVTLTGSATDSDGSVTEYQWRIGGTILATTASFDYKPENAGTDILTLRVRDDDGAIATDTINVEVGIEIPDSDKFLTFINTGEVDANVTTGLASFGNELQANNYYSKIDPDDRKTTLEDWYTENCFIKPRDGYPRTPPNCGPGGFGDTAFAIYLNNADLNFGRRMALRSNTVDVIGSANYSLENTVTSCVENYPSIEESVTQTGLLATVCMEYSPPDNQPAKDKFTKFYVYGPDGKRVNKVDLDGRGEKYQPGNCLTCHGGSLDPENTGSGSGDAVGNLNSAFIPWDLDNFKFSTTNPTYFKDNQEEEFRKLNQGAMYTYNAFDPPAPTPATEGAKATREMIRGWYNMSPGENIIPANKFDGEFIPDAWLAKKELYKEVVAPTCRACHVQRGLSSPDAIDFATSAKFESYHSLINTHVFQQATMPLAKRTFDVFWDNLRPGNQAQILWDELNSAGIVSGDIDIPGDPIPNVIVNSNSVATNPFDPADSITLDGRRSLFAASSGGYLWSVESSPLGATYTLTNAATSLASFKLTGTPTYGSYTFRLTVTNSSGTSEFEERTVNLVSARVALDFSDDIYPILTNNCTVCHAGGVADAENAFPMSGSISAIYAEVLSRVNTSNPSNSLFLTKPANTHAISHGGGTVFNDDGTDGEYNTILEWIDIDNAAGP